MLKGQDRRERKEGENMWGEREGICAVRLMGIYFGRGGVEWSGGDSTPQQRISRVPGPRSWVLVPVQVSVQVPGPSPAENVRVPSLILCCGGEVGWGGEVQKKAGAICFTYTLQRW